MRPWRLRDGNKAWGLMGNVGSEVDNTLEWSSELKMEEESETNAAAAFASESFLWLSMRLFLVTLETYKAHL